MRVPHASGVGQVEHIKTRVLWPGTHGAADVQRARITWCGQRGLADTTNTIVVLCWTSKILGSKHNTPHALFWTRRHVHDDRYGSERAPPVRQQRIGELSPLPA